MPAIPQENTSIIDIIKSGKARWPIDYTHDNFKKILATNGKEITNLSSTQFVNLIDFLNIYTSTIFMTTILGRNDLAALCLLNYNGLMRTRAFDDNSLLETTKLTYLFSIIAKQRNLYTLIYDINAIFGVLGQRLGKILKTIPSDSQHYSHNFLKPYLIAGQSLAGSDIFLTSCYMDMLRTLNKLGGDCLSADQCRHSASLIQIFSIFGTMAHKLAAKQYTFTEISNNTVALMKHASDSNRLTVKQIKEIGYEFSRHAFAGNNHSFIDAKCAELFKLPDCDFFIDSSNTTTISSTTTIDTTTSTTNSSFIPSEATNPSSYTTELTTLENNQTTLDDSLSPPSAPTEHVSLPTKLQAGAVVGVAMGVKDVIVKTMHDVCVKAAESRGCSNLAINSIKALFLLVNSVTTASVPLLIAYASNTLQHLENEEDPKIASQLIMSTALCFSLEALFATSYLLREDSNLKKIISIIKPLIVFLGLLGSSDIKQGLAIYGVTATGGMVGTVGTNMLMQKMKTLFFTPKETTKEDIELISTSSASSSSNNVTPRNSNSSSSGSDSSSLPDPTKFCYFIEPTQFKTLKDSFNTLIVVLGYIAEDYAESILNISKANERNNDPSLTTNINIMKEKREGIIKEQSKLMSMQHCLNEDKHTDACKLFETAYDMLKDESVKQLQGVFILLKRTLPEETIRNLNRIKGYNQDNALLLSQDDETLRNASLPTKLEFVVQIAQQLNATIQGVFTNYDKKEAGCNQKNSPTQLFKQANNRRQTLPAATSDELQDLLRHTTIKI
ncbi:MAG: hypothetical protein V4471_07225 [Pseudomonadota bacterium]